jgi:hypothetical protein
LIYEVPKWSLKVCSNFENIIPFEIESRRWRLGYMGMCCLLRTTGNGSAVYPHQLGARQNYQHYRKDHAVGRQSRPDLPMPNKRSRSLLQMRRSQCILMVLPRRSASSLPRMLQLLNLYSASWGADAKPPIYNVPFQLGHRNTFTRDTAANVS